MAGSAQHLAVSERGVIGQRCRGDVIEMVSGDTANLVLPHFWCRRVHALVTRARSRSGLTQPYLTRRKFFDVHARTGSAVAFEALERIGVIYEVERSVSGKPPDERLRQRQARSRPLTAALKSWAETILPQLSGGSDLAKAFRYMLVCWAALTRVFDDGRIALDNNPAERALQSVAIGRKNYLFAGSERGAERAAAFYTLIETAKLNGLDLEAYLRDVLTRLADHPAKRLAELLPWNCSRASVNSQAA
ncbi:hypothetical protein CCS92_24145 [Methylobacterium radiotolerans]|nr:hypothetical protein CCS92_24145 [Methylobacterium radiotolerans]